MKLINSSLTLLFMSPALTWAQAVPFEAPPLQPSQMDFGGVGLIQMPSGRMAPEGEFNFSLTGSDEYQFYNVSLQVLPWLETTIRYTRVYDLPYSSSFPNVDNEYTDKGIDFKFRLLKESQYLPELSVGVRDFAGTGLFDGEFVAATKRYSNPSLGTFDFTLGMGWGYLGTRENVTNPLCKLKDKYCERPSEFLESGGTTNFERAFKGPAALFGGIEYQTLHAPLRFKLEYDSNDYSEDYPVVKAGVDMTPHTPWNVGMLYRLGDIADLRISYERGDTLVAGVNFYTNFNRMPSFWRDTPTPEVTDQQPEQISDVDWQRVSDELDKIAGYNTNQIYVEDNVVAVVGEQKKYRDRDEAYEKAAAVLYNQLPGSIEAYSISERNKGLETTPTTISAAKYADVAQVNYINPSIQDALVEPTHTPEGTPVYDGFERFDWGFAPKLAQTLGSAEDFYLFSIGLSGNASYWLTDNLELSGSLYWDWYNNYDKFVYVTPPDATTIPRVRTMFRAYQNEYDVSLSNLQLTWLQNYSDSVDQQFYAGYLESMFAGVGTEFLYRPQGANWAIGADANLIYQRDPQSYFGVYDEKWQYVPEYGRPFQVIDKGFTGFVSGYYYPQWRFLSDLMIQVDVGQFLAGDVGTQINVSKQFKSGVIAGAFASFTDLSADEFGEGSFTKGFYISIPYDIMTVKPSNNRANFSWQPLTRDGGQKLARKYHLIELTDQRNPWYQRPNRSDLK